MTTVERAARNSLVYLIIVAAAFSAGCSEDHPVRSQAIRDALDIVSGGPVVGGAEAAVETVAFLFSPGFRHRSKNAPDPDTAPITTSSGRRIYEGSKIVYRGQKCLVVKIVPPNVTLEKNEGQNGQELYSVDTEVTIPIADITGTAASSAKNTPAANARPMPGGITLSNGETIYKGSKIIYQNRKCLVANIVPPNITLERNTGKSGQELYGVDSEVTVPIASLVVNQELPSKDTESN